MMAPAVSAQKPPTGLSLVIFEPMVWTMRHPPKQVPSEIAVWAAWMIGQCQCPPVRGEVDLVHDTVGIERSGDDSHGLLGVIAAVAKAVGGG